MVWFGFPWWEYHEAFLGEMRLLVFCFLCTLTVQVLFTVTWGLSFSYSQTKIGVSNAFILVCIHFGGVYKSLFLCGQFCRSVVLCQVASQLLFKHRKFFCILSNSDLLLYILCYLLSVLLRFN